MKKVLLIVVSLVCFGVSGLGQVVRSSKVLNVPLIGQETHYWCWAASMQMVIKYHHPSSTIIQKNLAAHNFNIKSRRESVGFIDIEVGNDTYFCSCSYTGTKNKNQLRYNGTIPTYSGYESQDIDNVFSKSGYNSIQDADVTNFGDKIRKQIDKCQPMILMDDLGTGDNTHLVVAVGYFSISPPPPPPLHSIPLSPSSTINLLAINNPLLSGICGTGYRCIVDERYYDRKYTLGGYITGATNITSIVKDIRPKNSSECADCSAIPIPSSYINHDFDTLLSSYIYAVSSGAAKKTLVRTISVKQLQKLKLPIWKKSNISNSLAMNLMVNRQSSSLTSKVLYDNITILKNKDNITYQFDNIEGDTILTKVSENLQFNYEPSVSGSFGNVQLDNSGNGIRYDIIEFPLYYWRFFRFNYKKKWYLAPCGNFTLDGFVIPKNIAFREIDVLAALKIIASNSNYDTAQKTESAIPSYKIKHFFSPHNK